MNLCVIPARGGSKRIQRKNIRDFFGKPIIAWSIEAAKTCGCFDRIIVSTDDPEIAGIAQKWRVEAPFTRPAELSDDHVGTIPVVVHAINWSIQNYGLVENVCCLYATAPFVKPEDLQRGLKILLQSGKNFAVTVCRYKFPIQRAFRITQEGQMEMFYPDQFNSRSQDLEEAWHDAGQFYWGKKEAWISHKTFFEKDTAPVILAKHQVQDIDTEEDWRQAALIFQAKKNALEL